MKKRLILIMVLLATTIHSNAFVIEDEGWTPISICQKNMNPENMDLEDILEIQTQDGLSWYSGEWNKYSTLKVLPIGVGVWVKTNKAGANFNTGENRRKLTLPLIRDNDFTLVGSCSQRYTSTLDMTKFLEIQNHRGNTIYQKGSEFEVHNDLLELLKGPAYWVKGNQGTIFDVKDNLTVPTKFVHQLINNRDEILNTTLDGYTIKLFADYAEVPNSQANHTGIIVRVDGKDAPIIHAQSTYRGKEIVVGIYNATGKLVGITDNIVANTEGVGTIINISITDDDSTPIVNHAPTINGTPSTTATVDTSYSFTPTASDSDGDSLSFSIDTKPNWLNIDTTTGTLSGTPLTENIGTTSAMTITVSDGTKSASLTPFTLTVGEAGCVDEMTDTHANFSTAKDNALSDVSKPFNEFQVKVTTSATIDSTSSSTTALYGNISGNNTGALLKLNDGYPSGTVFVVKVYKDSKLVGISGELISDGSAINFGSITTLNCSE